MEILGREKRGVMSLAASATSPTTFASLDNTGNITLWDTRLKRKDYMHVGAARTDEATELLLASDQHLAAVIAENTIITYDLRQLAPLQSYEHSCEVVNFLNGIHPPGEILTLVIDENGAIVPFNLQTCSPTTCLSSRFFGVEKELSLPSFGALSNYCCGLGILNFAEERINKRRLCALGMDGAGAIYTDPLQYPTHFTMMENSLLPTQGHSQVVNPPLPTTCDFFENYIAIGRGNGMYSIATIDNNNNNNDKIIEIFSAPGHASNGLCVVLWTEGGRLVTCSLCGELSAWDILPLLTQEIIEEEEEGELPSLEVACSVREATGQASVVNCGIILNSGVFIAGDTMGFLTSCTLE